MNILSRKINFSINSFFITYHLLFYIICFLTIFLNSISSINLTILFEKDIFADLYKVMDALKIIHCWPENNTYDEKTLGINFLPPFTILIYTFFAYIIKILNLNNLIFYLILISFVFISLYNLLKNKFSKLILFLMLSTYPFLFTIQRGNFSLLVFLFLIATFVYRNNRNKSLFFLALAVCIKITPIIFFIPLLVGNRPKIIIHKILIFLLFMILINILSILIVSIVVTNDIYDFKLFFVSQYNYSKVMISNNQGLNYGNSLYMMIKVILNKYFSSNIIKDLYFITSPYLVSFCLSIPFLIFFLFKKSLRKLNFDTSLEICSIFFILFTPITADYYLNVLLLPIIFIDPKRFTASKYVLYLMILLPKVLFYSNITISSFINPVLLILLLLLIIYDYKLKKYEKNTYC